MRKGTPKDTIKDVQLDAKIGNFAAQLEKNAKLVNDKNLKKFKNNEKEIKRLLKISEMEKTQNLTRGRATKSVQFKGVR
jgi:hypothetical protein